MSRRLTTTIALIGFLLLGAPNTTQAQPPSSSQSTTTVILVRHAEKEASDTSAGMQSSADVGLTEAGRARARLLATTLKDAGITAVFTSTARRTKDTAAPLAEASHLTPAVISEDLAKVRAQVIAAAASANRGRVLIVGHSNTVPALIAALGGPSNVKIGDTEFDGLFILTVPPQGPSTLLTLRYGAGAAP